jgi:hypothetical protein
MDNITIKKYMQDSDLIGLDILVESAYIKINQYCYVDKFQLEEKGNQLIEFANKPKECYVEFGSKEGNYTPAFSMDIILSDSLGHIRVKMDMEIDDNSERKHRCQFYISSNIGEIENFGKKLVSLISNEIDSEIKLVD